MRFRFLKVAVGFLVVLAINTVNAQQFKLTKEQIDLINITAFESWSLSGKVSLDKQEHCNAALEKITGFKDLYTNCVGYISKKMSDEQYANYLKKANDDLAERINQENYKKEQWKAKQSALEAEADAIALKVENGDRSAFDLCYRKASDGYGDAAFSNICLPKANAAYIKALRLKKFEPINCKQFGYANTQDGAIIPRIIRVSIESAGQFGEFSGEITQIDGKNIAVYDKSSRLNAIVITDNKTKIYASNMVSVGLLATGIGIQTGSRQVKLTSGQASTVAVISAKCVEGKANY